ncbi:hypothetical protein NM688_g3893 [Phlebia brevispora]|uniref:Uncharacterized protein n=1 Tax=Phlebia brevispora TaxID=194682 RepID=A0ACC1T4G1_9APHY|nr:hypothetical protein NM688_g3893 [Phlebia brevispora]
MAFFSRPSSSAVKIVAPQTSTSEPSSPKPSRKDSTQRQCRNILIYGSCKFQDKGCIYYHPPSDTSQNSPPPPDSPTPSGALPAQAVNAPIFVPKGTGSPVPPPATVNSQSTTSTSSTTSSTSLEPAFEEYDTQSYTPNTMSVEDLAKQFESMDPDPAAYEQYPVDYDGAGMDVYYPQSAFIHQPLNYHLYTLPRPEALQHKYFVSDDVREELQRRSEAINTGPPPGLNLPEELQGYHSLVPLEPIGGERRKFGNWYSTVYKAVNSSDGFTYALRRIENFRLNSQSAFSSIETWSQIKHPNLISVKEAFTTRAFNDNSLVVVFDYHPNSQTVYEAHIKPKAPQFQNGRLQAQSTRVSEHTVWSYVIQIAGAIRAVHEAGLAVRIVDATKVLVTGKNRIRISSCGIIDILMYEARQDMALLQQEDLAMFGKLVFSLCCNNLAAMNNLPKAIDNLSRHYSQDLKNVALFLISKPGPLKTIRQLFEMIGSHVATELEESQNAVDRLEGEFMSELENGRFVRLLAKLNFINERPEFARDPRWSETGDRYIVKLFRDYVFHQLDAGVDERIMLISRDEQSCLVGAGYVPQRSTVIDQCTKRPTGITSGILDITKIPLQCGKAPVPALRSHATVLDLMNHFPMSTTLLVALATVFFFALKRFIDFRRAVASIQDFPGFRTLWATTGTVNNVFARKAIPGVVIGGFRHWHRKYEDFRYFGADIISQVWAFPQVKTMFFVADPAAVKEITMNRLRFPKPVWQYSVLTFFGRNIVASEFDEWKRYRKITAPAFSEPNNKLVWDETVRVMNGLFDDVWAGKERIVMDHAVDVTLPIALFVIGAAGFGRRVSWKEDEVVSPGHTMAFKDALHVVSTDILAKVLFPDWFLKYSPWGRLRNVHVAFQELEMYMMEMCAARRALETKEERHDLFSSLLDASDDELDGGAKLTDRELLGNIFIFLLAGHETTAHTLCFTFGQLAFHPEEQEKLYQHIKSVLKDGRAPTYEDMGALTQSEAVFYETLRTFPPVVGVPKYAAEDTTLTTVNSAGEKVTVPIPAGSPISLHVAGLHYNPRYWEDPTEFKPDRFLGDWPRDAFLPFSGGARSCLGRRFFETEGIAILTMLISRYRVELKDEPEFAHETLAEKKARLMACKQGLTTTWVSFGFGLAYCANLLMFVSYAMQACQASAGLRQKIDSYIPPRRIYDVS